MGSRLSHDLPSGSGSSKARNLRLSKIVCRSPVPSQNNLDKVIAPFVLFSRSGNVTVLTLHLLTSDVTKSRVLNLGLPYINFRR